MLEPELADVLGLFNGGGYNVVLETRFGRVRGKLVRTQMTLLADEGTSLTIDATVFVSRAWPRGKNFIGYSGFLERVRFAVDPATNDIYFGAL